MSTIQPATTATSFAPPPGPIAPPPSLVQIFGAANAQLVPVRSGLFGVSFDGKAPAAYLQMNGTLEAIERGDMLASLVVVHPGAGAGGDTAEVLRTFEL